MSTFTERLREASRVTGFNQQMIADRVGVTPQAVHQWFKGRCQSMASDRLLSVAGILGVDPVWLASGEGNMFPADDAASALGLRERLDKAGDVVIVEGIKGQAGGDPGVLAMAFKDDELNLRLQGYKPVGAMGAFSVEGGTMMPLLAHGEIVLVDMGERECTQMGIYLVEIDGAPCVRRLRPVGEQIEVHCAAPGYPVATVDAAGVMDGGQPFRVRGRVITAMGFRRL